MPFHRENPRGALRTRATHSSPCTPCAPVVKAVSSYYPANIDILYYRGNISAMHTRLTIAFAGPRLIAAGQLSDVALATQAAESAGLDRAAIIFDAVTSEPIDLDLRGTPVELLARVLALYPTPSGPDAGDSADADADAHRGPGRPRLGVVGREVTLLPRHWDWLATQPGGASAAIRRLVDQARVTHADRDRTRRAQEYAYRFMTAMLGDEPDFEEATRALFASDRERFTDLTSGWPADLRDHARRLADDAFSQDAVAHA